MKRILSFLIWISAITLSIISCTFAYTQEQKEAYQWAYKYGITTQTTIEQAKMNSPLTRQAFAKMVVNYLENVVWVEESSYSSCSFPDENKITKDLKPYAKKTCAYEIMWSNWKNFNPTQQVDRAQLWTVISRILWWDKYNVSGKWYYIYHLNALQRAGIMNKINNPKSYTKRWDVMIMLKRLYEKYGSNVYMVEWNQKLTNNTTSNEINNTKLNIRDYNDSLVDIFNDCYNIVNTVSEIFYSDDSSTDLSISLESAIKTCTLAKNKVIEVWDFEWDSMFKDAVITSLDAELSYLNIFTLIQPYLNLNNFSESNANKYENLIIELWENLDLLNEMLENLRSVQSMFADKYWLELENGDYNYVNWNVVYIWKDWTQFYYDEDFLKALKDTAEKKWELDLVKYLDVEIELLNFDIDSEFEFDSDEFYREIWIDFDNTDPNDLTKDEKEKIVENIWTWFNNIVEKAKNVYDEYDNNFYNIVNNSRNDKFWLREKYNKTNEFFEVSKTFIDDYAKSAYDYIEAIILDDDISEEWLWMLDTSATLLELDYQFKTNEYNKFLEERAKNTIELLWWELIY